MQNLNTNAKWIYNADMLRLFLWYMQAWPQTRLYQQCCGNEWDLSTIVYR